MAFQRSNRRDCVGTGGGVFICVKECLQSAENFKDSNFEMLGVDMADDYSRNILHIIGLYRAPKEGLNVLCKIRDVGKQKNPRIICYHCGRPELAPGKLAGYNRGRDGSGPVISKLTHLET
ncbi:hypothetical protein ANN_15831 [Periplaneta americana]|uniref:Uncharacterized protein n=1 Tax=Periplaneta americana TaxID=6978 RepID=A0ABQ8SIN4_PERAM|nr:hypothetical protein ANN_15831 [Periplaneta americana]